MKFDPYDHTHTKIPENTLYEVQKHLGCLLKQKKYLSAREVTPLPKFDFPVISVEAGFVYSYLIIVAHEQYDTDKAHLRLELDSNGNVRSREWLVKTYPHRKHLPASIYYDEEGKITNAVFRRGCYRGGVLVSEEDLVSESFNFQLCDIKHKKLTFWETYGLAPRKEKEILLVDWLPLSY